MNKFELTWCYDRAGRWMTMGEPDFGRYQAVVRESGHFSTYASDESISQGIQPTLLHAQQTAQVDWIIRNMNEFREHLVSLGWERCEENPAGFRSPGEWIEDKVFQQGHLYSTATDSHHHFVRMQLLALFQEYLRLGGK